MSDIFVYVVFEKQYLLSKGAVHNAQILGVFTTVDGAVDWIENYHQEFSDTIHYSKTIKYNVSDDNQKNKFIRGFISFRRPVHTTNNEIMDYMQYDINIHKQKILV